LEQWQWTIIANWGGMVISRLIDIVLRTKNNNDNNKIKTSRFIYVGKPIFKGEIKNRQEKYDRSKDKVIFKSRFNGKIEYGYFAAEIVPPEHSSFPSNTFHLDNASRNVTSFCDATLKENIEKDWNITNIPPDLGKIHGRNVKTDWFEWTWKIPEYAPKGDYRVIIGLWSDSQEYDEDDKSIPIQFSGWSFHIMDSDASRYQQKVQS
jgi:hypothetical protein